VPAGLRLAAALLLPVALVAAGWSQHGVSAGLALAGAAVAAVVVARGLLRAVAEATAAARRIAAGDFAPAIPVTGPAVLQGFVAALNDLATASARRDDELNGALEDAATQRDSFYSILNASNDGLLLYDNARRLVVVNQRCGELLGFSRHELLHREPLALQLSLEERCEQPELYRERLERHFARPDEPHQDQLVLREPRRRVLRRYSCPVRNHRGLQGRVFTYTDVTTESDVDRLKSEFVSMASHELRTPLTSVHGALQLALSGSGDRLAEEDRELLAISLANTERLVRLVNDLLDLSKIEAGRMPMSTGPLDVRALLDEAARGMQGLAATRSLAVACAPAPGVGPVQGDHDQLLRVVTNLLGNALKYSPPGTTVCLASRSTADGVEISVQDEGPGIPPDQVDRLFRPFSRVGVHARQTSGGTGLGLAISRAIVEQHRGRIWAEPGRPSGSRFAFVIPRAAPATEPGDDRAVA